MPILPQLTKKYLAELADFQTTWATSVGIKGYEGIVSDFSSVRIQRHLVVLKGIQKQLSRLPKKNLSFLEWIERDLLAADLKLRSKDWGISKKYQKDPSLYVGELIYGLWYIPLRISSPSLKIEASCKRMLFSEKILSAAQANLKNPPRLWTKIAMEEAQGYLEFLKEVRKELCRLAPRRSGEIEAAFLEAKRVGEAFLKFLRGPLLKRSHGRFAVGKREFNDLLKTYHHYPWDADQLLKIGGSQIREIQKELQDQAKKIQSGVPWTRLLERIKKQHPPQNKLLTVYRKETQKLRRFLRQKKIVSIPQGESLEVIETPAFTRNTIPYAAYIDPPMFGRKNRGVFFVTPITIKNKKQARKILEEHNWGALRVTALHEGYPGHHLQFAKQFHSRGTMTKIYNCSSFYEGWALYCEEMMYEAGYYDEETRLIQLKDKLWRACRVVVDVSLHTGRMTDAQAVHFLSREAKMTKASSRADVNWYTMRPTIPQSYLTGMLQIKKLREAYRKKLGKRFSLQKFHDDFLRYGAIPISLVAKALFYDTPQGRV